MKLTIQNIVIANAKELIRKRRSIRTYKQLPIPREKIIQLSNYFDHFSQNPFEGNVRFEILELEGLSRSEKRRFGTYGFIHGANTFIVGIITKPTKYDYEHFGYLFERVILFATYLGLGTCWVGGTFKRSVFAFQLNLSTKERIPVITPIGIPAKRQSLRSSIIKKVAGSHKRKLWSELFFEGEFENPLTKETVPPYSEPLEMVRLAPSASNFQPWRIIKEKDKHNYHFYINQKPHSSYRIFKYQNLQRIDLGIAVYHFHATVTQMGLTGDWQISKPNIVTPNNIEYLISWNHEERNHKI